jgi:hypothetical protein
MSFIKTDRGVTKLKMQPRQQVYITDYEVLLLLFINFSVVVRICLEVNIKHRLYKPGMPLREITFVIILVSSERKLLPVDLSLYLSNR